MHDLLNPSELVKNFSYTGIFLVIFLESGIPFGFFLPGDSLLFTAGLLASTHDLNIIGLVVVSVAAAILGNNAGYFTGKWYGRRLFKNPKSFWFSPKRLDEAGQFFVKEGPQSLVLARFIPAGRTFVPIAAGAAKMDYRKFFIFNTLGAVLWGLGLPILGYSIGKQVPNIDKYLLPIVLLIVFVSAIPAIVHWQRKRK